ncbi:MAG: citryl-CoA lyase [Chloroflexi bacterium]|nr:citryl-CoA lyase [Chloroflexota bacterium]
MPDPADARRPFEAAAWASALTDADAERVYLRGRPVDELIGRRSFAATILLLWLGHEPEDRAARIFEACLVAAIDHGARAPSAIAARTATASRSGSISALAAGILSFGHLHGTVVTGLMEILAGRPAIPPFDAWAEAEVASRRAVGQRVPGIGHRSHEFDRRAERLFGLLAEAYPDAGAPAAVQALARAVGARASRPIPINVDGAIAACLDAIGLPPVLGDFTFVVARTAGLAAHIAEELERGQPMRTIDPSRLVYDGPAPTRVTVDGGPRRRSSIRGPSIDE